MIQPLSGDGIGEAGEEEAEKTGILPSLGRCDLLEKGNADPKQENSATGSPQGGVFVSTRVEHKKTFGKKTTAYIELDYDSESTLLTVQIKVMANGLRLNSGAIARPPLAPAPSAGAPAAGDAEPWLSPTARMINQLFTALDGEFTKLAKAKQEEKKDVFSRVFGKGYDGADLATALRHNLNLLIGNIR